MNIVHIAPNAPYNEGWGYQENLLPKYQTKLGHDVTLIVTDEKHDSGEIIRVSEEDYLSESGFRVIRKTRICNGYGGLLSRIEIYDLLLELRPDVVFFHGLVSITINQVVKYKKRVNQKLVIIQDNHQDYQIGQFHKKDISNRLKRLFFSSLYILHDKYINKVYGVTPWRREYAEKIFRVPKEKTDVLIMGADDDYLEFNRKEEIRKNVRNQFGVNDSDFLIVTGGKIDSNKKIDILMKACSEKNRVKLLIFGSIASELEAEIKKMLSDYDNLIYIGWIDSHDVYKYYFAADLIIFPGQHSVLWEQACASKTPCVFERWEGMEHVNNGGNSDFVSPITEETLSCKIDELLFTSKYTEMNKIAQSDATDIFLYSKIAEKSLESVYE